MNLPPHAALPALLLLLPWVSSDHRAFVAYGAFLFRSLFLLQMHTFRMRTAFHLPSGWQQLKHKAWTRLLTCPRALACVPELLLELPFPSSLSLPYEMGPPVLLPCDLRRLFVNIINLNWSLGCI